VFATATGIVGAVVTLMGLLALPQMLRGGYDVRVSAGAITAGGCLGILIPPSVMLIVYGATAGVSVVQLYAGAFFPGIMLAGLYIVYVIVLAKLKPHLMPPLSAQDRFVPLPPLTQTISDTVSNTALPALLKAMKGQRNTSVPTAYLVRQLGVALIPLAIFLLALGGSWHLNTRPIAVEDVATAPASEGVAEPAGAAVEAPAASGGLQEPPSDASAKESRGAEGGLQEPPGATSGLQEPPGSNTGVQEPPGAESDVKEPPGAASGVQEPPGARAELKEPTAASGGGQEPAVATAAMKEPSGAATPAGAAVCGI